MSLAPITTLRHGVRSARRWLMWPAMLGLGTASGVLRVGTGDQWATDVIVGASVGSGVGLLLTPSSTRDAKAPSGA